MSTETTEPAVAPRTSAPNLLRNLVAQNCSLERAALLQPIINRMEASKAPASTSVGRHGGFEGGLADHTLLVMRLALGFRDTLGDLIHGDTPAPTPSSVVTATLLHDLNKVERLDGQPHYVPNFLTGGERSTKKPWKANEEINPLSQALTDTTTAAIKILIEHPSLQYPSGLLSLALAEKWSPGLVATLSEDEKQAIVWHGGAYEKGNRSGFANKESLLWLVTHAADFAAAISGT